MGLLTPSCLQLRAFSTPAMLALMAGWAAAALQVRLSHLCLSAAWVLRFRCSGSCVQYYALMDARCVTILSWCTHRLGGRRLHCRLARTAECMLVCIKRELKMKKKEMLVCTGDAHGPECLVVFYGTCILHWSVQAKW